MLGAVRRIHGAGIDILAGFIVGFDRDTAKAFEVQRRFIRESGIMVAMVGLLTALPKTPLYERLKQEGRLIEGAANGDNTQARSNIVPKHMSAAEMSARYKRLYAELLTDRAIAERIRNKLAHFGVPAELRRETPSEKIRIVRRLLWHGIAKGGPLRAWHFLRSLPLARPRLVPLALNDWIAALAMKSYAQRNLFPRAERPFFGPEQAFDALRARLRRWRRRGTVRMRLRGRELLVRITGRLDRRLASALARSLPQLLERSQTRIVLAIEAAAGSELERLSQALARCGDRARLVLGPGL